MKLLICNNTTHNFLWEPEKIKFKFHRNSENTDKFVMPTISFCEIWSFWSLFSRAPTRSFSLKLFHITYYIISTRKNVKKNEICLKLFWYKVFVSHWKLKWLNFLMESVLRFDRSGSLIQYWRHKDAFSTPQTWQKCLRLLCHGRSTNTNWNYSRLLFKAELVLLLQGNLNKNIAQRFFFSDFNFVW